MNGPERLEELADAIYCPSPWDVDAAASALRRLAKLERVLTDAVSVDYDPKIGEYRATRWHEGVAEWDVTASGPDPLAALLALAEALEEEA